MIFAKTNLQTCGAWIFRPASPHCKHIFLSFQLSFTLNQMALKIVSVLHALHNANGTILICFIMLLSSAKVFAGGGNYSRWKQSILGNYTPGLNLIEDAISPDLSIQLKILLLAVWAFRPKVSEIKMLGWHLWMVISSTVEVSDDTFLYEQVLDWLQGQPAVTVCRLLEGSYDYERIADNDEDASLRTVPHPKFIPMLNAEIRCRHKGTLFWIKRIQQPYGTQRVKYTLLITCFGRDPGPVKELTTFCQQRVWAKKEEKTLVRTNVPVDQ